jgi:iron complex outermembrane receptor protein
LPLSHRFRVRPLALFVHFAIAAVTSAAAAEAPADADDAPVPTVTVSAARAIGLVAQKAASLYDTPPASSVLTRACPDTLQVTTLNDAIQTTAGVASDATAAVSGTTTRSAASVHPHRCMSTA